MSCQMFSRILRIPVGILQNNSLRKVPICRTLTATTQSPVLPSCRECNHNRQILTSPVHSRTPLVLSSCQYATIAGDQGILDKIRRGIFPGRLRYKRPILQGSGLRMYLSCVELPDYQLFFKELALPDTFNSWFRITELHIWMCMVRLTQEGKEGKFVRNNMVRDMWKDVEKKSKKLGNASASVRKESIQVLSEQFKSSLFAYDEGLLDNDRVLAGAIWRNFFDMECDDPEKIELVLHYMRKQISRLDNIDSSVILSSGLVSFLPLTGDLDTKREEQIMKEILRRV